MKHKIDGQGIITLPGSKSIAIRCLIIGTYLDTPLMLSNFPDCEDCLTLLNALKELGFAFSINHDDLIMIPPQKANLRPVIYIKDSAAALRFLLFRLAGWHGMNASLLLSPQLACRPLKPVIEIIKSMGGKIIAQDSCINIEGRNTLSFTNETKTLLEKYAAVSSQFLSGCSLTVPSVKDGLEIPFFPDQVSLSYLNLTIDLMESFGITIKKDDKRLQIPRQNYLNYSDRTKKAYRIEEDFSSACYFWAIGALSKKPVGIRTTAVVSKQPDFAFLKLLKEMGAVVRINKGNSDSQEMSEKRIITVQAGELQGIEADMRDMPDQVPTLALLALFAQSPTRIKNTGHLKYKETDRIAALIAELGKIGAEIGYEAGILTVKPLKNYPQPVILNTYNDHRLVMTFTILTLILKQLQIDSRTGVTKSFPGFFVRISEVFSSNKSLSR